MPPFFHSSLFSRKRNTIPLKELYTNWIHTLNKTLLPHLRHSLSSSSSPSNLLSTHVESIHLHFQSYYDALNSAASQYDVAPFLFPTWRNSLEKPFLFLGDLHPYLFTNLLRSFLDDANDDVEKLPSFDINTPWHLETAWSSPTKNLMNKIEQIECGVRLMVPALAARAREAQSRGIFMIGEEWVKCEGKREKVKFGIEEGVREQMDEMMGVFVDANRLRKSVLADIMSATSIYQAALFYQALGEFLVGFRDKSLITEFNNSKMSVS